jgi:hypothetical protein
LFSDIGDVDLDGLGENVSPSPQAGSVARSPVLKTDGSFYWVGINEKGRTSREATGEFLTTWGGPATVPQRDANRCETLRNDEYSNPLVKPVNVGRNSWSRPR